MKKKGLVVIYDPHALIMFLQYYCMNNHSGIEWDALCLPKENGKQEMSYFCEKSGIFKKIYTHDSEFMTLSLINKVKLFVPMCFIAAIHRQEIFAAKIYNSIIDNIYSYEYYAANCESGFMAGLLASFAKNKGKKVIYFEDGSADYMIERKRGQSYFRKGSFENFQCILMAKMGYCGKGFTYFEPTKHCYKYATHPEELAYKNYRSINKLHLTIEEQEQYRGILEKMYPELEIIRNEAQECDLVQTMPLTERNSFRNEYKDLYIDYIDNNVKGICLKKHPRDKDEYIFSDKVYFYEIPQDIPAEVIFPFFNGKKCFMMEPDSTMLSMGEFDITAKVLYSEKYAHEEQCLFNNWKSKASFVAYCNRFVKDKFEIIEI